MARHCPHHTADGALDEEQLIYSLGTIGEETWLDPANLNAARKHLDAHYQSFIRKILEKGIQEQLDINSASLAELVSLPQVGPVLAVRIVRYRASHGAFVQPEDIRKVEGIGPGVYHSVRHYIKAD
jgi:competence ComEA-like helix-hairpin-helix protein